MSWFELFRSHDADAEQYAAGEWIYREGEAGTLLFVLLAGTIELSRRGAVVDRLEAPDFFGEAASLGAAHRADSACAVTEARVLPIGPARLSALADKHPALHAVLAEAVARRGNSRYATEAPSARAAGATTRR